MILSNCHFISEIISKVGNDKLTVFWKMILIHTIQF